MNIKLYILSAKTQKFYIRARKEYEKRLNRYCKLIVKEYKGFKKLLKDAAGDNLIVIIKNDGMQLSSEELAHKISSMEVGGISNLSIVIADENSHDINFDKDVIFFSISKMKMSIELTSVVVLEQIYRAYKIINGETYHK